MNLENIPVQRLFWFALIGGSAATVHLSVVFLLVKLLRMQPLMANVFAFFSAFTVSYLGHKHRTFADLSDNRQLSLPHFFLVASSGGLLNEFLYYLFLKYTPLHYIHALILVIGLVAVYTYLASRYWACRDFTPLPPEGFSHS